MGEIDVDAVWKKIQDTPVPEVKKVALAFSGGLDSSLAVELLRRRYKVDEIVPVSVDVGQGDEEIGECKEQAKALGIEPLWLDGRDEFTTDWLAKAIRANSDYFDDPVSTSMTRQLIARMVSEKAAEVGADALMEGSTGTTSSCRRRRRSVPLPARPRTCRARAPRRA